MSRVILTDGGMGQELVRRSSSAPTPLWSARVLIDEPDLVRDLHREFIEAGARVVTINTYSATPERLAREGVPELFKELQARGIIWRRGHDEPRRRRRGSIWRSRRARKLSAPASPSPAACRRCSAPMDRD